MTWDRDNPPSSPPAGVERFAWRLIAVIRDDHTVAGESGTCSICDESSPCAWLLAAPELFEQAAERGKLLGCLLDD